MDALIQSKIESFKVDLTRLSETNIVQKHITYGDCFILRQEEYFLLKSEVAKHFDIHPSEIVVVGSAKLGFSIAPHKRYNPFGESSDIDIAIVSPGLFDKVWLEVFNYSRSKPYWPGEQQFKDYLFRGWIRPDKLPPSKTFSFSGDWWEFFRGLTNQRKYGAYSIRAGIYKSWHFLESYHSMSIKECKNELEGKL